MFELIYLVYAHLQEILVLDYSCVFGIYFVAMGPFEIPIPYWREGAFHLLFIYFVSFTQSFTYTLLSFPQLLLIMYNSSPLTIAA
jgi:hypothetical protein